VTCRVLSVSSDRADVGLLEPVWAALAGRAGVELQVLLTGSHCVDDAPAARFPANVESHKTGRGLAGAGPGEAAAAMAAITKGAGEVIARARPDIMLVACDRLDMLSAALASLPFNLPLAHLHGGEITSGAIDDRIRHALTKMSHLHLVATVDAAMRVSAMGEEAWRIEITGGPGIDQLLAQPDMERAALCAALGLRSEAPFRLVTVHPETNARDPLAPLRAVLAALESRPGPAVITAPNPDPGAGEARACLERFAAGHDDVVFSAGLGSPLYANAMRHAETMIGNSSSGVIEASLFGLPVINVGRRQDGRERGANVRDVAADAEEIVSAMDALAGRRFAPAPSVYGDGEAAPRIAARLASLPPRDRLLDKRFDACHASFRAPWT
jgi:UDP-hydrolysing UDP-N-acetyl-D-glucosamine 2-epimerase